MFCRNKMHKGNHGHQLFKESDQYQIGFTGKLQFQTVQKQSDMKYLTPYKGKPATPDPELERLNKVVSEAREYNYKRQPSNLLSNQDEYWEQSDHALPIINDSVPKPSPTIKAAKALDDDFFDDEDKRG